jgi:tetratricopeptide (TPR) repeat protein
MNLRPKTRQRLMVMLLTALGLTVGLSVLVFTQLNRYERHRQALRAAGMDAYQRGDYRTATDDLSKFLSNDRVDSPAIYAYAVSRKNVPKPDMSNLVDARLLLNHYLDLNPGDLKAEHQLLEIYQTLHYISETTAVTDQILAQNPDDIPALSCKLQQLTRDLKFGAALPISQKLNDLSPNDLRAQETTYFLMSRLGKTPPELVSRANSMLSAHPNDPRYELLRAVAAYFSSDLDGARQWLRTAASGSAPDADFTLMLVNDFDRMQMWGDALELLKRVDANPNAPVSVKAALVQRLWEFKQYDAALTLLKNVNPQDPAADSQLIGLKALVLHSQTGAISQVQAAEKTLQARSDDMVATGWALLLSALCNDSNTDVFPPVQQCIDAEHADPDNPDIRFFLGEQYDRLGENELALQCFRQASQMQPEWPAADLEISRDLRQRGQSFDAIAPAMAACERDPQSFEARKMLAQAQYEQLGQNANAIDIKPVLNTIEQLRADKPTDADLLLAQIDLLARSNQIKQAAAIASAAAATPGTLNILHGLAGLERSDALGIAPLLIERAGKIDPASPQQASELVDIYIDTQRIDKARALLPKMQSNVTLGWRLAWLKARDDMGDGSAVDWQQFADSAPGSLVVQRAAMKSATVSNDRALLDRTIDRLKALTGEDAIAWRMARARWLLTATEDTKNRANAAAELMQEVARVCPDYAQPRVILGDALAKVGDYNGAIVSVQLAKNLEPQDPHISLKLASLFVHQGMLQQATGLMVDIENAPQLSSADRLEAARIYREAGVSHRAVELLQDAQPIHCDDFPRDLLLAQLLAERGDHAAAVNIFDRWMQQPAPPPAMVEAAAWYSASHGMMDRARQELARLDSLHLRVGENELARARFEAAFGTMADSLTRFENAAKAAPSDPEVWAQWAAADLRARDFVNTVKVAGRGLRAVPNNQFLMSISDRAQLMSGLHLHADAQPLFDALANNPSSDAGVATLGALHDSQEAREGPDGLANRLRALCVQFPRFVPAVDLLVTIDCSAGHFDAAGIAATRARDMLPADAEPARLLSVIWSSAGRWQAALAAANDWRSQSMDQPQAADIAIATAQIALGRPGNAVDQLSTYASAAVADASPFNAQAMELTAKAMCMQNHVEQAWRMMKPLVLQSTDWRRRWLQIVAETARDSVSVSNRIEQVAATVPSTAISDQLSLGQAWLTAGVRLNDIDLLHKAEAVATSLTDSTSAPADAWLLLGSVQMRLELLPDAESALAKALKLTPDSADAKNLLASVKLLRNTDLPTARLLATDCVNAYPARGDYHDTLGEIDVKLNDLDSARAQFELALNLNPENAEALICLASVLDRLGQPNESSITLAHAEIVLMAHHSTLPAPVQSELQRLRDLNRKPGASAAVDPKH